MYNFCAVVNFNHHRDFKIYKSVNNIFISYNIYTKDHTHSHSPKCKMRRSSTGAIHPDARSTVRYSETSRMRVCRAHDSARKVDFRYGVQSEREENETLLTRSASSATTRIRGVFVR